MRIHKIYIAIGLVLAFTLFFELAAHADEANRETIFTFNEPVQIPGAVLPAGTYRFELLDPDSQKNIVQIFTADRTVLFATVQTVSVERLEPAGDTTITLAEPKAGGPDVLVKWFYPGRVMSSDTNSSIRSTSSTESPTLLTRHLWVVNRSPPGSPEATRATSWIRSRWLRPRTAVSE